ncbi:MAG TPA: polysaccharide biosynthesis tyrosine autokinase [Actinomycetaceae bacterium]|nr:polysaccharide biosynthesis tyrosine autokinase [Actinomycetaceae bacterium]
MDLNEYLYVLRRFWKSILVGSLLGLAAGAVLSLVMTPTYTASTSLFFAVRSADSISEMAQGSSYAEQQVESFARVATAPIVLQPVIDSLELDDSPAGLAHRVQTTVPEGTSILDISVSDTDSQRAADTVAGIAESLIVAAGNISARDSADLPVVEATVISPPVVPTSWTTPNVMRNLTLGFMLGLLLGMGQALLRHVLDRKIRTAEDVARVTEAAVVGTIALDSDARAHPLAVGDNVRSARAEDYRRLRTALRFLGVGGRARVFAISSAIAGEGKSTTTLNLAFALAATNLSVLVIEADLRRPSISDRLDLENAAGLTSVLIGRAYPNEVVQPIHEGLHVLTSGGLPPNPSELLGSDAMREVIELAAEKYDYVLLDTAPLLSVADTAALASMVDGILIVAASGQVEAQQLQTAIEVVHGASGHVAGIVLNKATTEAYYRDSQYPKRDGHRVIGLESVPPGGEPTEWESPPPPVTLTAPPDSPSAGEGVRSARREI